ncbi:MAG TPA: hypothetical protein VGU02_08770 [Gaiellaceae bacterium]|nr:hypothetical protein [Gaiellaceae bacterium]
MNKRRFAWSAAVVLVFAGVVGLSFFLGDKHALESLRITHVAPATIARAMQDDRFFADYHERTLVVTGTVASFAREPRGVTVRFRTPPGFAAFCDLEGAALRLRRNQELTVIAEGATAERQSSAVMLRNCRLP